MTVGSRPYPAARRVGPQPSRMAAVNISAPKFRLGHNLEAAGLQVLAAARHLSQELNRRSSDAPASSTPPPLEPLTAHQNANNKRIS